eukprot:COSAG02_NODE_1858_length_10636_cov_6.878333_2_plen_53_part_00
MPSMDERGAPPPPTCWNPHYDWIKEGYGTFPTFYWCWEPVYLRALRLVEKLG